MTLAIVLVCVLFAAQPARCDSGVTGEIGFTGELYNVSAGEERRPSESARLFFRPTLNLFDAVTINFDFALSTEGSSARQDVNQIDVNPKWSWGEAHLGDFSQSYSPLTLNGVQVRGGGLELYSRDFTIGFVSGRSKREVSSENNYRSFRRNLNSVRVGIGSENSSHVNLIFLTVKDELSSAFESTAIDTGTTDTTLYDSTLNPASVTPMENMVLAIASQISFANKKLVIQNEISGSALTRDRRSSEIGTSDIPDFLTDLFTPRVSSNADYAHHTKAKLKLSRGTVDLGYRYIGPGYMSLGLASQRNDLKEFSFGTSWRLNKFRTKLSYLHESDNLIGQKAATTDKDRIVTTISGPIAKIWNPTLTVSYITMKNDAVGQLKTDYHNISVSSNNILSLNRDRLRSLTLSYLYAESGDDNPLRPASGLKSHNARLGARIAAMENLILNPSVGLIQSYSEQSDTWLATKSYSLVSNYNMRESKLKTTGTIIYTDGATASSFRTAVKADYPFLEDFSSRLEIAYKTVDSKDATGTDYNETTARLEVSRSF
jgi:hypothetical protein